MCLIFFKRSLLTRLKKFQKGAFLLCPKGSVVRVQVIGSQNRRLERFSLVVQCPGGQFIEHWRFERFSSVVSVPMVG
jgi:hypothetical protein